MFSTKQECLSDLSKNYTKPGHPIAFSGINTIYDYYNKTLTKNEIINFLASIESYSLHRDYKQLTRNPSFARFKRYQFQIDLADVRHLKESNNGVQYIFTSIDCYTRFAFCRLLYNKSAQATVDAFISILHEAGTKPYTICADRGSEIRNKKFLKLCEDNGIKLFHNFTSIHASYIERFNRSLKRIMYSFMTENETTRYVDHFDLLVASYNQRKHRMIGLSPMEAENPINHRKIDKKIQQYYDKFNERKPKYYVGQLVRIAKQKGAFNRGFHPSSIVEIFRIKRVNTTLPIPLYILEEYDKSEEITGGFYAFEITPVNSDIFRVEKVLRKAVINGVQKLYVKWKGFSDNYNSWINKNDIVENFQENNGS